LHIARGTWQAARVIIRRDSDVLLFITQPDHARLAAEIMAAWREGGFDAHPRRDAIRRATVEHDNGWIEEDAQLHVGDSGDPLDFISMTPAVKHRIWPRAVERLSADPYVAALVAQHALTVHGPLRTDPAWRGFFSRMEGLRADMLARSADGAPGHLAADYAFVQLGDQLSLIFCNAWTATFPRVGGRTILTGTTLEVIPDPFGGARVPLRVGARRLAARAYASAADLRDAYEAAPTVTIEGVAVGGIG
jgi:hypothetical protein